MRIGFVFILLSIGITAMAQSPWVAENGKGFVQLGYTTIGPYSDLYFNGSDVYNLSREVTDQTIQVFGEYGIGSKTSLIASIPFKLLKTGETLLTSPTIPNAAGSFSTLGNIQLAARHNFINKDFVLSGQFLTEIPSAGYDNDTGLRGGLDALSISPSISIGKGLANFYGFVSTGVAIRTNNYSSEFRTSAEVGYKIINRVFVIGVIDIVENFENGNATESANQLQTGLYLNNQSYFAYGIKGIIGFTDNLGVSGAFYGASSGNLVAKSPSVNFGLYYKW